MQKIKVLLVDDEFLALQLLENFVKEVPELELVAKTKSPIEAQHILSRDRICLLYTSPSPRDATLSRMPSSA